MNHYAVLCMFNQLCRLVLAILLSILFVYSSVVLAIEPELSEADIAVITAVADDDIDSLRSALVHGYDPNRVFSSGQSLLGLAATSGRQRIVSMLLQNKADANLSQGEDGYRPTPIFNAVCGRNVRSQGVIKGLVGFGAQLNTKNGFGQSALVYGLSAGCYEGAHVLLREFGELIEQEQKVLAAKIIQKYGYLIHPSLYEIRDEIITMLDR